MSYPTDTNQASKDELENLIRNNIHTFADEYLELDECVDAIQALIRTEKLKLLAEVRERAEMVVGNVFDPSGKYVSVSEIDKLEAEL